MKKFLLYGSLLSLMLLLQACGSLPEEQVKRAQQLPATIEEALKNVDARAASYTSFTQTDSEYQGFFRVYADKESWAQKFDDARHALGSVRDLLDREVKPMLKRNDPKETSAFTALLNRADTVVKQAKVDAEFPFKRMEFLHEARAHAPEWAAKARQEAALVESIVSALEAYQDKAKADHPSKAEDIAGRGAPIISLRERSSFNLTTVRGEFVKVASNDADYAIFADAAAEITHLLQQAQQGDSAFRQKTEQLYHSYSKTLIDMRIEGSIDVTRTSWNECGESDFPPEHEYVYSERKIDDAVIYDALASLPDDTVVAEYHGCFFSDSVEVKIDQGAWDALRITDPKEGWPSSGDDYAEYTIEDDSDFFHKYLIEEDGVMKETGWIKVEDQVYDDHDGDLGMTIVVKPYGMYEDEAIKQATPAGMAVVGNSRYGEWKHDDASGRDFWSFYGRYRFYDDLLGPNRYYYRDDWEDWRTRSGNGRSAYYGRDPSRDTYGSGSAIIQSAPRYRDSNFARQGGFRLANSSVRGAGPSTRGGGPGGGGK